jgi:hypothetical protein
MIVNLANGLVSDVVGESATVTTKMQSVAGTLRRDVPACT